MKDLDQGSYEADGEAASDPTVLTDSEIKGAIADKLFTNSGLIRTESQILIRDPIHPADPGDWMTTDNEQFGSWYVDGPTIDILVES